MAINFDDAFIKNYMDTMYPQPPEEPAQGTMLAAGPVTSDAPQAFIGTRLNVPRAGQAQPTPEERQRLGVQLFDTLAGMPKGAIQATAGLPGDLESIGRAVLDYFGYNVNQETVLPTAEDVAKRLESVLGPVVPKGQTTIVPTAEREQAAKMGETIGEFLPVAGVPEVVVGGGKAIGRAARAAKGNPSGILLQDAAGADVPVMKAPKVESKAFKNWFGDSKAVDEANKPIVVYHARRGDFEAFDPNMGEGKTADTGTFFSTSPEVAATYNTSSEHNIVPAYLSLKKPFIVDFNGANWNRAGEDALVKLPDGTEDDLLSYFGAGRDEVVSTDDVARLAREQGYDGVIIRNVVDHGPAGRFSTEEAFKPTDIYVAFKPEQIKSVMNKGTFDPDDPRMLYGAGGTGVAVQQEENQ
jgi:hypothetical protein